MVHPIGRTRGGSLIVGGPIGKGPTSCGVADTLIGVLRQATEAGCGTQLVGRGATGLDDGPDGCPRRLAGVARSGVAWFTEPTVG